MSQVSEEGAQTVWTPPPGPNLQDVRDAYRELLYLEKAHLAMIDYVMALVLGQRLQGENVWSYIIGPPSCGKGVLLDGLRGERGDKGVDDIVWLSQMSDAALVSGYKKPGAKKSPDYGLLPKLNGKILVIKELTPLLTTMPQSRDKILGQFRDAYDQFFAKKHGNETDISGYYSKFGFIAAVTPEIDRFRSAMQALGERCLAIRWPPYGNLRALARKAALANDTPLADKQKIMKPVKTFLEKRPGCLSRDVVISPELLDKIIDLGMLTARLRSTVARKDSAFGEQTVLYRPEPEVSPRLVKQLVALAKGIAVSRDRHYVIEDDLWLVRQVTRGCLTKRTLQLLDTIHGTKAATVKYLHAATDDSYSTLARDVGDLVMLGVLRKTRVAKENYYSFIDEYLKLIDDTGYFDDGIE